MKQAKRIMTTSEAAEYLTIPVKQFRRLYDEGHIHRLRGCRNPMQFSKIELDRYLSEGVVA
ncbi:excisionase family DNA-binding protein [Tichowtungia aerotolerans]|uniref:Excisionase family DNA-binding protein n=1 Tax=Tichowtungia aerotolerans TaxID=2697043 RepID=A0A6P1MAF5_9BACT|nr:excisionase family DNA-binding protein [Tichowtungia aerotolerans]QHI69534.1 excisionase family DNA-binding protein [Tichowtungia aerotolerans]